VVKKSIEKDASKTRRSEHFRAVVPSWLTISVDDSAYNVTQHVGVRRQTERRTIHKVGRMSLDGIGILPLICAWPPRGCTI
jgi:glucuronate isomerase